MKIDDLFETGSSGGTVAGNIASVPIGLSRVQKRGNENVGKGIYNTKKPGNLLRGKISKKTKVAESAVTEDDLREDDIVLVPGQGRNDKSFISKADDRRDHEVEMARSDLYHAAENAKQIYGLIKKTTEDEGLPGWVQEKIIKANDYLNTVREYLEHKDIKDSE